MKKFIVLLIICLTATLQATGQSISFNYDSDGNMTSRYTVTLRSGQQEDVAPQTPDNVTIALDDIRITVSPNPTRGEIFVDISPLNSKENNFLQVFDLSGRLIETRRITSERSRVEIRGGAGVYLINIHLGVTVSNWKIIKQ